MSVPRYLRTDEREEAVRSLEWAEVQTRGVVNDPYAWKWVLLALHNATQGFMVLALWNGNGVLSLSPKAAAGWHLAHQQRKTFHLDRLDKYLNLYAKVKDQDNFHTFGAGPFLASASHDGSIAQLNEFRNEFIHFTPKGWSLELAGLPRLANDALDLVQFFAESTAVTWYKPNLRVRATGAVKRFRRSLAALEANYGG